MFPCQAGSNTPIISDMAVLKAIRRTAGHDQVDAHGFRAVFCTHTGESLMAGGCPRGGLGARHERSGGCLIG